MAELNATTTKMKKFIAKWSMQMVYNKNEAENDH